jgi:hypothetical protein
MILTNGVVAAARDWQNFSSVVPLRHAQRKARELKCCHWYRGVCIKRLGGTAVRLCASGALSRVSDTATRYNRAAKKRSVSAMCSVQ